MARVSAVFALALLSYIWCCVCGAGRSLPSIRGRGLVAIKPRDLAGCWQVVPGVGSAQLGGEGRSEPNWKKYSRVLGAFGNKTNRNFQFFSPQTSTKAFVNLSEFIGSSFYAYTEGTYEQLETRGREATVTGIIVVILRAEVKVKVSGRGLVSVRYADSRQRVFENEDGAVVLQEKVEVPKEYEDIFI